MFIPLYDGHPLRRIGRPVATWSLIAATVATYIVFQSGLVIDAFDASVYQYGLIPASFSTPVALPAGYEALSPALTLVTSLFLHADLFHLGGNMLFLWVFGDNVEDAMGHLRFIVFYLLCGIAAGLAQTMLGANAGMIVIGASGAVAGVVAAYLLLHPRVKLWVLFLVRIPLRLSAAWVLGGWIAYQIAHALLWSDDGVAWWAHVGGFAAGAALIPLFKAREVPLFDRELTNP